MTETNKKEIAQALKTQFQNTFNTKDNGNGDGDDIIADAEKNGYLPKVELSDEMRKDIEKNKMSHKYEKYLENNQINYERYLADKKEQQKELYLRHRECLGKELADPNHDFNFGNWSFLIKTTYIPHIKAANQTLSPEEKNENKQELIELTKKYAYLNTSQIKEPVDWLLKDEQIVHQSGNSLSTGAIRTPMAFSPTSRLIYINDSYFSNENNNTDSSSGYKMYDEARKGNPAAYNCLIYHELNHKHNWEHDGLGQLTFTPINAAKGDILTEKISLCTEYLHMVQEYNNYKKQGIKTIEYNNQQHHIDSLLEICPGLKEAITQHGSDLNDPKTKKAIVQAAMTYWDKERGKVYTKDGGQTEQTTFDGYMYFITHPFSKQLQCLQQEEETYNKVSTAMLSDINIGDCQISLTDCKDIIDTFTNEDAKKMMMQKLPSKASPIPEPMPTLQEYQEINTYLESIGKTTDAEKMQHIVQTLETASPFLDSYDKKLEDIMLSHNPTIYSGFTRIEKKENAILAIEDEGSKRETKYDLTEYTHQSSPKDPQQKAKQPSLSPSRGRE